MSLSTGRRISQANNRNEAGTKEIMILVSEVITALSPSDVDVLALEPLTVSICSQNPQITETKYRLN
jgi:hypothetical protein